MAVPSTLHVRDADVVLSPEGPKELELSRGGKYAIWCSIFSFMFLSQIAYNIGEFPAETDLFVYGLVTAYLLATGVGHISVFSLLAFLTAAYFATLRVRAAPDLASFSSLLLLFALYLPFHFRLKRSAELSHVQDYIQRTFVVIAATISIIAVAQLVLVNGGVSALTNINFLLPDSIKAAGIYRFGREAAGGLVKANGFFLREASTLSIVTAFALLIEYFSSRRTIVLCILAAGQLCSISGSGIFIIIASLALPTSLRRIPSFLLISFAIAAILALSSEVPALSLWVGRLSEFNMQGTSGYARFVAPFEMVQRAFDQGAVSTLFGSGGGSYLRTVLLLQRTYEISDPTWAKLIYEYGLVGFVFICGLFVYRVHTSALRSEVRTAIAFAWIVAANVLKPEFVLLVWILTLVPRQTGSSPVRANATAKFEVPAPVASAG